MTFFFRWTGPLGFGTVLLLAFIFSGGSLNPGLFFNIALAQGKTHEVKKVERIVFIDKEEACPCTRNRCDQMWKTLSSALKKASVKIIPEKLFIDKDKDREIVMKYRKIKPFDWIPVIYFLGAKGSVLTLLEGEITEADILKVIQK